MTFNQWLIVSLIMIKNFRIFAPQDWNVIVNFLLRSIKRSTIIETKGTMRLIFYSSQQIRLQVYRN